MTKKKIFIFFLLSFFFFCGIDNVFAASISVAGTTSEGVVGGNVTVNVTVKDHQVLELGSLMCPRQ